MFHVFRKRLQGPEVFLATDNQLTVLLNNIVTHTCELREQLTKLTGENNMRGVMNGLSCLVLLFCILHPLILIILLPFRQGIQVTSVTVGCQGRIICPRSAHSI